MKIFIIYLNKYITRLKLFLPKKQKFFLLLVLK